LPLPAEPVPPLQPTSTDSGTTWTRSQCGMGGLRPQCGMVARCRSAARASVARDPACGRLAWRTSVQADAVVRADARTDALVGAVLAPEALSAVEHRPADVVPRPLVVEYELANRLRELVALPPALGSPCALALSSGAAARAAL